MQNIEKDLIIKASAGDIEAFRQIYDSAVSYIYNLAYRVANNKEDARDVTQDVLIKVYKNLKSFNFRASFQTWLYRITINTAINFKRKSSEETNRRVDYEVAINTEGTPDEGSVTFEKMDNEETVASLLNILNPDYRACLVLREIERLSYQEISEVLDININTVRSRLKRAREILLAYRKREVSESGLQKSASFDYD